MKRSWLLLSPDANTDGNGSNSSAATDENNEQQTADAKESLVDTGMGDAADAAISALIKGATSGTATTQEDDEQNSGNSNNSDQQQQQADNLSKNRTGKEGKDDETDEERAIREAQEAGLEQEKKDDGDTETDEERVAREALEKTEADKVAARLAADPKSANDSKLPFNNHPRWKEVVAERDTFRNNFQQLQREVDTTLKPLAKTQQDIATFCEQNNIQPDQFRSALDIMALMNQDPAKALEAITPIVEQLRNYTGNGIAPDLRTAVEAGELTEAYAKQITQLRAKDQREKYNQSVSAKRSAEQQQQQAQLQLNNTVAAWWQSKQTSDPDFATKQDMLGDVFAAQVQRFVASHNGRQPNATEITTVLEESLTRVNAVLTPFRPTKQPIRPPLRTGTRTGATGRKEPSTWDEAISGAIATVTSGSRRR